jgi:hypothetical protein
MKKIILLGIITVGCLHVVSAQIQFGVKAGYSLSHLNIHINPDDDVTFSSKSAFHGGLLVKIPVMAGLCVQPELLYSGEGAKYNDDGDPGTLEMGYINVPVMVKYSYMGAFLETGPQVGFLVSAKDDIDGRSEDIKADQKSVVFDWCAGLGYQSKMGLGIDARYNFGLMGLIRANSSTDLYFYNHQGKSDVLQIGLFWMFGAAHK